MYQFPLLLTPPWLCMTSPPILLEPMLDGDTGATTVPIRCTVYMTQPFVPILLAVKLSPVETWQRLRVALVTANFEADCRAVIDCFQVVMVCSTLNESSPLLTSKSTAPLTDAVLLKHRHAVLIQNIPCLNPFMSQAMGSLIATIIGDLVLK